MRLGRPHSRTGRKNKSCFCWGLTPHRCLSRQVHSDTNQYVTEAPAVPTYSPTPLPKTAFSPRVPSQQLRGRAVKRRFCKQTVNISTSDQHHIQTLYTSYMKTLTPASPVYSNNNAFIAPGGASPRIPCFSSC